MILCCLTSAQCGGEPSFCAWLGRGEKQQNFQIFTAKKLAILREDFLSITSQDSQWSSTCKLSLPHRTILCSIKSKLAKSNRLFIPARRQGNRGMKQFRDIVKGCLSKTPSVGDRILMFYA